MEEMYDNAMSHILHSPPLPPPPHENKKLNIESTLLEYIFIMSYETPNREGKKKISFPSLHFPHSADRYSLWFKCCFY